MGIEEIDKITDIGMGEDKKESIIQPKSEREKYISVELCSFPEHYIFEVLCLPFKRAIFSLGKLLIYRTLKITESN